MAARDHMVEVIRGMQRQDRYRARVDIDRHDDVQRVLHDWLRRERVDEDLWVDYKITVLAPSRLIEVAA